MIVFARKTETFIRWWTTKIGFRNDNFGHLYLLLQTMVSKGFAACPIYHAWKMLLGPWKAYTMLHSLTKKLSKFCRTKESTVIVLQVHNNISHYNSLLHCITFQLATKPIIVWNCLPLLSRAKMHSSHMNLENCIKNGNGKSWGTRNSDKKH